MNATGFYRGQAVAYHVGPGLLKRAMVIEPEQRSSGPTGWMVLAKLGREPYHVYLSLDPKEMEIVSADALLVMDPD